MLTSTILLLILPVTRSTGGRLDGPRGPDDRLRVHYRCTNHANGAVSYCLKKVLSAANIGRTVQFKLHRLHGWEPWLPPITSASLALACLSCRPLFVDLPDIACIRMIVC